MTLFNVNGCHFIEENYLVGDLLGFSLCRDAILLATDPPTLVEMYQTCLVI